MWPHFPNPLPSDRDKLEFVLTQAFQDYVGHTIEGTEPFIPTEDLTELRDHHRKVWNTGPNFLFEHIPGTIKSATLRAHWLDLRARPFRREEVPQLYAHFVARANHLSNVRKIHIGDFGHKIFPETFVEVGVHIPEVVDEAFYRLFKAEILELIQDGVRV